MDEDTLIVKSACLIIRLLNKNTVRTSTTIFQNLLNYLIQFIQKHKYVGACDALRLMQSIIKNHFKNEQIQIDQEKNELFASIELILNLLNNDDSMVQHYDGDTDIEIKSSAIFCLESILWSYEKCPEIGERFEDAITQALIKLIYSVRFDGMSEKYYCMLMRSTLNAFRYIGYENREWCKEYLGDILGACVSNMLFGLPDIECQPMQKVQSSQQTVSDKQNANLKKGGKLIKGRRPRQKPQLKTRKGKSQQTNNGDGEDELNDAHSILFVETSKLLVESQ